MTDGPERVLFYYFGSVCKWLLYCGLGDFWPNTVRSRAVKVIHGVIFYALVLICYVALGMGVPVLFSDKFSSGEKSDCLNFTFGPSTVIAKYIASVRQRANIRSLISDILDASMIPDSPESAKIQRIRANRNIIGFACCVTSATFFYTSVGVYKLIAGGPFYALYTYWPYREDVSIPAQLIRLVYLILFVYEMVVMLLVDGLCISLMIKTAHKLKTLCGYFRALRVWLLTNPDGLTPAQLGEEFRKRFVTGLKYHSLILSCGHSLKKCFHLHYTLTISQSALMMSFSLIRFVVSERDVTNAVLTVAMCVPLLTMLGLYMAHAGNISYESCQVSQAMYESGWELLEEKRRVKALLLLGIQQGQMPIVMKAFGTYEMTHSAFVTVLKTSYSIFAVFY